MSRADTSAAPHKRQARGSRRGSRELALQALYQWLLSGDDVSTLLAQAAEKKEFARADAEYFRVLLRGVIERAAQLVEAVQPFLDRPVEQLSPIERALLLMAAYELIVALDVPDAKTAEGLVEQLHGVVSFFKIGYWLLIANGNDALISKIVDSGKNVFLDYKMFDIDETVKEGVRRAMDRGVKFVTVHGNSAIMRAASEARGNDEKLKIFAITVLTSMDGRDIEELGYHISVKELIEKRVRNAIACGCDGIIASPSDNPNEIRKLVSNQGLLIATPGVRPSWASSDDHKRPGTPEDAIRAGADYLVVGRPIIKSPEPRQSAERIIAEMKAGAGQA